MTRNVPPELEEPQVVLPRNFLRPCLLLLLKEGQSHGYDLMVRLADFGLRVDPGGLYRMLRTLEREGLVKSRWETSGAGPARRNYTTTTDGENWLRLWGGTLRESRKILDRFIDRYETAVDEKTDVIAKQ